ncbi:hypothetical protein FPRO05_02387 [Fusarium proliferatum]|uniref:Xylanolytic transcriptional activator regulatory domain-containing protein n=1 Tax=Gibberella intermedia TaxID=948311 RepID=A0A365MYG6_GIBIN|nr:hypothetical protein FPRO05_02387 [Fusarium proliferatum]
MVGMCTGYQYTHDDTRGKTLSPSRVLAVHECLQTIPNRSAIDFLVQHFIAHVNWMIQLVHPPWFLNKYHHWWTIEGKLTVVEDVEFAVLLLRICLYAAQFLPSPAYTADRIRGIPLADIRSTCSKAADVLTDICAQSDTRGSLFRVLHLLCDGLVLHCAGKTTAFWATLGRAVLAAQRVGLHEDVESLLHEADEVDKEMHRWTFCNLYVLDSTLSLTLDRVPFLPDTLRQEVMPRMHLAPENGYPEPFLDRISTARLVAFWRNTTPKHDMSYDGVDIETVFNKFCNEFISMLPPVFALQPDRQHDELVPALPLQRQLLHVNIYFFTSLSFRRALMRDTSQDCYLPSYKRVLLSSQLTFLASLALKCLDCTHTLHTLMGGSQMRCPVLISSLFEMALLLVCLCARRDVPADEEQDNPHVTVGGELIGISTEVPTRGVCLQALQKALETLQMLADVSDMAEVGARHLEELMSTMTDEVGELKFNPPHEASGDDLVENWDWESFPENMVLDLDFALDTIICRQVDDME